jgi:cysteinyl-tRNA synthetase
MSAELFIYNTLSKSKERFEPINAPHVGIYACGPTVYSDPHLGHARQAITYDILFRYLQHLDYKVRYVRNITDVGHLENEDTGEGEDRIAKKARLEQLEPMEVVQHYTNRYHFFLDQLQVKRPSIEPRASGHIIEQQELVKQIIDAGFGYEKNGSVYFDVEKYNQSNNYGKLSGRRVEDLLSNTRTLDGQSEKKSSLDFALWKKASPEHIMRWPSAWSDGFPGWHLECSAMSHKYLGKQFDIHGGGMDLMFPHHECEIAQNKAGYGEEAVKYWMHNNMITINGQKMARSLNNFITLEQLFNGDHEKLEQAYTPMTVRFFMLQAHYRSTLDFSNEALQAAEKGFNRLMKAHETLKNLKASEATSVELKPTRANCYEAINDDFNTPIVIAHLFDAVKLINSAAEGKATFSMADLEDLKQTFDIFVTDVLGLVPEGKEETSDISAQLIELLLELRGKAKQDKNYAMADEIRDQLSEMGVVIKDSKDGASWELN